MSYIGKILGINFPIKKCKITMKINNTAFIKRILFSIALLLMAFYLAADDYSFSAKNVERLKKMLKNADDYEKSEILDEILKEYKKDSKHPEKMLEYGQKALESAQKINNIDREIAVLADIGFAYRKLNDNVKALEFAKKSLKLAENKKNTKGILYALKVLGDIYVYIPDNKKSLEIYMRMKSIYEDLNDKKGIAKYTQYAASCYYDEGETNIALQYFNEALRRYKELGDTKKMVRMILRVGKIHGQYGYTDKALENYLEAVKISETHQLDIITAAAYSSMGSLYAKTRDYPKALKYFKKSIALYKEKKYTLGIITLMGKIGSAYKALKQHDKALDYFHKALESISEHDRSGRNGAAEHLLNIGHVFFEKKKYNKAMENYKKALDLGEKFKDLYIKADCDHHIGKIKLIRGNLNQALVHFENSLEISKKIKKVDLMKDNYKYLSGIYSRYGSDKRSFEYFKLYTDLKDRIFNEKSANKIADMQTKFEMGKKEKEVEILKKDNQIQKLRINHQRIIRNGLIIVFILALIIVLQFFKKYRYLLSFWKKKNYIGHYKVMDKIASGGMGIIYKAHDILDKSRTFAVKVLRDEYSSDEIQKKRFKNEASIIDQFNHPNIVKVIERGESSGNLYIVMELLNGKTLSEIIKEEGKLTIGTVLNILSQVTDALVKIHRKNIIHRDLKPENIMIIKTPENPHFVKLLDFGLAKTKAFSRLTKTGIILGTIFYLSPEQILDSGVSAASDVYSMGIICCEMLTGQKPFGGDTEDNVISQILNNEPLQPSRFRSDIPKKLNQLIKKMISKNPQERPSAEVVLNTLIKIKKA